MILILTRMLPTLSCLGVALLLYWQAQELDDQQLSLLTQLPYTLASIAAGMALFSNHSRELALSITVFLAYWLVRTFLQASLATEPAGQVFSLLSVLFPVIAIVLLFIPESGCRHPAGLAKVFAVPVLALLTAGLFKLSPEWFLAASNALMADLFYFLKISTLSYTLFITAALGSMVLLLWRGSNLESSLLGCSLLCFVTLGWFHLPNISTCLFSCCGLLLIVNQLRDLLNLSFRDELTQIGNRRALLNAAKSLGNRYCLAMVDIDHFKKINDTHGHDLGDQVLKIIASKLKQVGGGGKAYRYGGEEFCILFRGKSIEDAEPYLEELRKTIAEYDMVMRDKNSRPKQAKKGAKKRGATRWKSNIRITVSIGVSDSYSADGVFESVMKTADGALYGAKRGGRNRIQVA